MDQEVPPLHTMHDVWDLITGPKVMPWSSLLVHDHLGSDGRLALFQACRGGRDLVLTTAEQATVKVAAREGVQLQAAKVALVTRGNLPTKLHLEAPNYFPLLHALSALEQGTTWLDELQVECPEALHSRVLDSIARCCPYLRALDIRVAMDKLPPPDLFPNLKQLRINDPTVSHHGSLQAAKRDLHSQRVRLAVAPYLSQLAHLTLRSPDHLPTLLSPANLATQLCSLDLRWTRLDDTLLGLLLQGAPALEQLAVHRIELQSDVHVHTPATWRQLQYYDDDMDHSLRLSSLARLPNTPPGLLIISPTDMPRCFICSSTLLQDAVAAGLVERQFRWAGAGDHVWLDYEGGDDHAVLRVALSLLHAWAMVDGTPSSSLSFSDNWTMTREVMMELHTGLPRWQRLQLSGIRWLPGEHHLYASLLRLLPDSYRAVVIPWENYYGDESLSPEQVVSICCGAPVRTAEAPLHIKLKDCPDEVYQAIQDRMQQSLIPNVVVVRG